MSKILILFFGILMLVFVSIGCSTVNSSNEINKVSLTQATNQLDRKDNPALEIKTPENNKQSVENNGEESKAERKIGKCQPENVPRNLGLIDAADMNDTVPKPETREKFNEWLSYGAIGSVEVAEMEGRKYIEEYYAEGDFNGDECPDVAIIVQGVKDKAGEKTLEQTGVDVTVKNLRTGAVFEGGDIKKLPFTPKFKAQSNHDRRLRLLWCWMEKTVGVGSMAEEEEHFYFMTRFTKR